MKNNKKMFQEVIDNEFDKEKNYQKILERIEKMERKESQMKTFFKYSSVAAMFVVAIIGGMTILKNNDGIRVLKPSTKVEEHNDNVEDGDRIIINSKSNSDMSGSIKINAKYKEITLNQIQEKINTNNIVIPNGFEISETFTYYTKEDTSSNDYNILHDYVINYKKDDNGHIFISFSEVGNPIRDYHFDTKNDKKSMINKNEVLISKYGSSYIATFKKDSMNFDIETKGISEEELIELLKSII